MELYNVLTIFKLILNFYKQEPQSGKKRKEKEKLYEI